VTWTRIDDQFDGHPKVVLAWEQAPISIGLHARALSHSGAYLTDGAVTEAYVKTRLPAPGVRRRVIAALVSSGLWEQAGSGLWLIHDYLHYNESRAQVLARREADSVRKDSRRNPAGIQPSRVGAPARAPAPYPFPTRAEAQR
jgi:hypothetical protein